MTSPKLSQFIDDLQAKGKYCFTTGDIAKNSSDRSRIAIQSALRRLKKAKRIVCPRSGFFVVLQPEYRALGCPPASWFIDDLMRYLDQPYYISLLSAAALHGAAHQQPMVFQVMTDRPTPGISIGAVSIEFHMTRIANKAPIQKLQGETGYINVATPEVTALDLVRYPKASGHLNNIATVLSELSEIIDPTKLVDAATLYSMPDVQRLGYLLDKVIGSSQLALALLNYYEELRRRPVLLNPNLPRRKRPLDKRWCVVPNDNVETDL